MKPSQINYFFFVIKFTQSDGSFCAHSQEDPATKNTSSGASKFKARPIQIIMTNRR